MKKRNREKDPYYEKNKELVKARSALWAKNNKEKRKAIRKKWRDNNIELARKIEHASSAKNRKQKSAYQVKYRENNPGIAASYCAKRRTYKMDRTPKWLTAAQLNEIEEFYVLAKELQWLSEEPLQVDHIIPLKGKIVSGLHVPWNLQILPRPLNCKKSNNFDNK
jgi:hypothetical protein